MLRKILGYAILAIFVLATVKIAFALLGTLLGLAIVALIFAAMGYGMYLLLRVISPKTAAQVRELMGAKPAKIVY